MTPAIISLTDRGSEDWNYTQFHPQLGLEFRPVSDEIYELYAVRNPEKIDTQPTFTIFPDAQEYTSRDLFVHHPSRSDLWKWQSRADDIIVFLNGEKTNPISMEQHIVSCNSDISAALVVGARRFQASLLIEPIATTKSLEPAERAAFIEKIWPTVEESKKDAPSHARLMKSHVLFTQPQKPMLRAGKGTVQRSGTLESYASEIDALYRDADMMSTNSEGEIEDPRGTLNEVTVSKCVTADTAPGPNGYSESKYVAEQIIDYAAQTVSSGPSFAFSRVGQIAGAANHSCMWNKDEWFPSMIISSVQIGGLPDSLGSTFDRIDWIPIDLLADILVELALGRGQSAASCTAPAHQADVYHPLNPHTTTWAELRTTILHELGSQTKKPMDIVPLRTWIAKVRKAAESTVDRSEHADDVSLEAALRSNPAAKLLDFFEHLVASERVPTNRLDFSETLKLSKAMRGLEPIKYEWVWKWIREWFAPATDGGRA